MYLLKKCFLKKKEVMGARSGCVGKLRSLGLKS